MHSEVLNCDIRAVFPTPGPPSMCTRYESTGPNDRDGFDTDGDGFGDIGLFAKLLLRDLFLRNESPRFITPVYIIENNYFQLFYILNKKRNFIIFQENFSNKNDYIGWKIKKNLRNLGKYYDYKKLAIFLMNYIQINLHPMVITSDTIGNSMYT